MIRSMVSVIQTSELRHAFRLTPSTSPRNSQSVFRGLIDELMRILINQFSDTVNSHKSTLRYHQSTPRVDRRVGEAWYSEKKCEVGVIFEIK
jgi:hypothetical protein